MMAPIQYSKDLEKEHQSISPYAYVLVNLSIVLKTMQQNGDPWIVQSVASKHIFSQDQKKYYFSWSPAGA